jgi:hypothetical protein
MNLVRTSLLALATGLTLVSVNVFAEPPVKAGETLESLSKAKVVTTVNGQPGTLQEALTSGQMTVISEGAAAPTGQQAPSDAVAPIGKQPPADATALPEEVTLPAKVDLPGQPEANANDAEAETLAPAVQ